MENRDTERLAEKIARLIAAESTNADLSSLLKSIDALAARLDKLEAGSSNPKSQIQIPKSVHPSQDRFAIAEAIVDDLFARDAKEKACAFETSKPCDHCAMCSSRGF
jgi:hypothetical protein